ncbi:glycosyltransferase family 4 protein [Mucilaginibacter myungsuensis]|uniref:Glycosyltransferase family 4 protein n=1 Tax=Mucilaginibacter myungsuensis TaxID=649104 RepID=A0A929PYV8_9SPHI|nr:glycosyltransferase family 4 protein [Mucilaginibacter myungsuensis]MBE9663742.1 glycosyltransferase family 4 protein [Mucilaginibacter myungsuensis]MDN3598934.1 glycosyltransferase family 4 protein [Mucilaginibacter myungsuensis]
MKIKYLPLQAHCFAYGGFDIQMLSTSNAINDLNVVIEKMDIWNRDAEFDILHCWGLGLSHSESYHWAKRSGKKLVATILMHDTESFYDKFRFKISSLLYKQRMITELLRMPDKIVVVNEMQADFCNLCYKVPSKKIHVIPNVIGDVFFERSLKVSEQPKEQYILTVGNICQRKNQIALAQACIAGNFKLVIVGKVMDGENVVGAELAQLVNDNKDILSWIPELKENSEELVDYYQNCLLFALPSHVEQQPISMLEAAVLQKPILTADRRYARQKYYQNAKLVNPSLVGSIKDGIDDILRSPLKYTTDKNVLLECRSKNIGESYKRLYSELLT